MIIDYRKLVLSFTSSKPRFFVLSQVVSESESESSNAEEGRSLLDVRPGLVEIADFFCFFWSFLNLFSFFFVTVLLSTSLLLIAFLFLANFASILFFLTREAEVRFPVLLRMSSNCCSLLSLSLLSCPDRSFDGDGDSDGDDGIPKNDVILCWLRHAPAFIKSYFSFFMASSGLFLSSPLIAYRTGIVMDDGRITMRGVGGVLSLSEEFEFVVKLTVSKILPRFIGSWVNWKSE